MAAAQFPSTTSSTPLHRNYQTAPSATCYSTPWRASATHYVETYNKSIYYSSGIPIEFIQDDISLSHRNVLRGLSVGSWEGRPYLAFEHVEGESLGRVLSALRERGCALPVPMAVHIAVEVCRGLRYAHGLSCNRRSLVECHLVAGGESPEAIDDHAHAEPERFVGGQRLDVLVADSNVLRFESHNAHVGVVRAARLRGIERAHGEIAHGRGSF